MPSSKISPTQNGTGELPDKKTYGLTVYSHQHYVDKRGPLTVGFTLTSDKRVPEALRDDATDIGRFYWICVGKATYPNPKESLARAPRSSPTDDENAPSSSTAGARGATRATAHEPRGPTIPFCKGVEILIAEQMAKSRQLAPVGAPGAISSDAEEAGGDRRPDRKRVYGPPEEVIRRGGGVGPDGDDDGEGQSLRDRVINFGETFAEQLKADLARYRENLTLESYLENAKSLVMGTADIWAWARDGVKDGVTKFKEDFEKAKKELKESEERKRK